jgi:transposase InsO family protein
MDPPSVEGYKHCIVAIDCFSKYAEVVPIKDKKSHTVAQWFYRELVARYGKPRWVRVDSGKEFEGDFKYICEDLGIFRRVASSGYPRSNGQVERFNHEIKKAIRKYASD